MKYNNSCILNRNFLWVLILITFLKNGFQILFGPIISHFSKAMHLRRIRVRSPLYVK